MEKDFSKTNIASVVADVPRKRRYVEYSFHFSAVRLRRISSAFSKS